MRIAFYAPLKPPDHPTPSGDRRMAGLLIAALRAGGHRVDLACHFRSREGAGDSRRQHRLAELGGRLAERLIRRYRSRPEHQRPQAWFTYHLYYKAPDHLGPRVADALAIPSLAAAASHAGKRALGAYAPGHDAAAAAIRRADALILLNGADAEGLLRLVGPDRCHRLLPFLEAERPPMPGRREARAALARELGLPAEACWMLSVAMMRPPDNRASNLLLPEAAARFGAGPWPLILIGEGPERPRIEAAFAPLRDRVVFAGLREPAEIARVHAAADLFLWPAVNEAFGMAILEASAAGLPVVAGAAGGVPEIVRDGRTGLLVPVGDAGAFAAAARQLIEDEGLRRSLGQAAARTVADRHGLTIAVQRLDDILSRARAR